MFTRGYVAWTLLGGLLGCSFLLIVVRASPSAVPAHCDADVGLKDPQNRQVEVLCGDYTVRAVHETWEPKRHYKVFGNLIIPAAVRPSHGSGFRRYRLGFNYASLRGAITLGPNGFIL